MPPPRSWNQAALPRFEVESLALFVAMGSSWFHPSSAVRRSGELDTPEVGEDPELLTPEERGPFIRVSRLGQADAEHGGHELRPRPQGDGNGKREHGTPPSGRLPVEILKEGCFRSERLTRDPAAVVTGGHLPEAGTIPVIAILCGPPSQAARAAAQALPDSDLLWMSPPNAEREIMPGWGVPPRQNLAFGER